MPQSARCFPPIQMVLGDFPIGFYRLLISLGYSRVSIDFSESTQTIDCSLGSHGSRCRQLVSAACDLFVGGLAFPDADSNSSDAVL